MTDYYDNWFFTSNLLSNYECPNVPFECEPPNACARDPHTGQRYCCDYLNTDCWRGSVDCATDGSTIDCGSGDNSWCCLEKTETCTQAGGQTNICWNTVGSTLVEINLKELKDTYLSLSSASPTLNSWAFTPAALIAQTQTTSPLPTTTSLTTTSSSSSATTTSSSQSTISSSQSTTSSSQTNTSSSQTNTSSPPPPTSTTSTGPSETSSSPAHTSAITSHASHKSSKSISGGAIAGIVIGAIAVIALLAAALFYFLKRRNAAKGAVSAAELLKAAEQGPKPPGQAYSAVPPSELHSMQQVPAHELAGHESARELYA